VLYLPAWLDQQVSNTCTEIAARTMGMVNLPGSIQQDLVQIPTSSGPTNAAIAMWHLGEIDIANLRTRARCRRWRTCSRTIAAIPIRDASRARRRSGRSSGRSIRAG
jgi:hypothetical protein